MPNTIFYWDGVISNGIDVVQYTGRIQQLINGEYAALNLEKLNGHNIYSIRLNREDRLLFNTVTINERPYLLLLDVVLNHDYAKSKFLKPKVLKQFLEANEASFSEFISAQSFNSADYVPDLPEKSEDNIRLLPMQFYNQMFVQLNCDQNKALTMQLPFIISGAPGSGKSLLAFPLLTQAAEQLKTKEKARIVYVSRSKPLVEKMKKMWEESPYGQNQTHPVEFLTYIELLNSFGLELNEKNLVTDKHCIKWIRKRFPHANAALLLQEFRLISAYTKEEYMALSPRQTMFKENDERQFAFEAYQSYHARLQQTGKIHPAFYALPDVGKIDFMFYDEGQDSSRLQLQNLKKLCMDDKIILSLDTNQSVGDSYSILPFAKQLFKQKDKDNLISMSSTYRCPEDIARLANAVLNVKRCITGGLADKDETQYIQLAENHARPVGSVRWINSVISADFVENIRQNEAKSIHFAIVTPEEYKDEAIKLFNTPLIFTPEEIKGLEYSTVLAYRIFDTREFEKAGKWLRKYPNLQTSNNRAKSTRNRDESLAPAFNEVFTGFTRTTENLIIFQDYSHTLEPVINSLYEVVKIANNTPTTKPADTAATNLHWEQELKKQNDIGNTQQAENIVKMGLAGQSSSNHAGTKVKPAPTRSRKNKRNNATLGNIVSNNNAPAIKNIVPVPEISVDEAKVKKLLECKSKNLLKELRSLFQNPGTAVFDLLFKTLPEPQGKSLFLEIIQSPKYAEVFNWLINSKKLYHKDLTTYLTHMPREDSETAMSALLSSRQGISFLLTASMANNSFQGFNINAITSCNRQNKSLLSLLIDCPELLCPYLSNNACLTEYMTRELLIDRENYFEKLAKSGAGLLVLSIICETNQNFSKSLTLNDFFPKDRVFQPGHVMAEDSIGINVLSQSFEANPNLTLNLNSELLFARNKQKNTSLFLSLSGTQKGQTLLIHIFSKKPEIILELSSESFYKVSKDTNLSLFLLLCSTNLKLLHILFENNPSLMAQMTLADLCYIKPKDNFSPFFFLSLYTNGKQILQQIFKNNPKIVADIPMILLRLEINWINQNITPVTALFTDYTGHMILNDLISAKPLLLLEVFNQLRNQTNLAGVTAFTSLLTSDQGIDILEKIVTSDMALIKQKLPEIFNVKFITRLVELKRPRELCGHPEYETIHETALHLLMKTEKALLLFQKIIEINSNILKELTEIDMCSVSSMEESSPLSLMLSSGRENPNFIEFRKKLCEANPAINRIVEFSINSSINHVYKHSKNKINRIAEFSINSSEQHLAENNRYTFFQIPAPDLLEKALPKFELS